MEDRNELLEEWRKLFETGATSGAGVLSNERLQIEYRNWCLKKLFGAFEFGGVPDTWDYDYMLENLFMYGYLAITDTSIGVIPLRCGVTGINVFNHPTTAIFANPVLGNFERNLYGNNPATDCALVKLQYDFMGAMPVINRYAALLALCDNSISVNLRNSKVAFIGFVSSKQQAATVEKMYSDIDRGKPAVYVKRGDGITSEDIYYNHVKETYIANDVQLLKQSIKNDFLTEVGLNNANTDKRERLIVDEVNANNVETATRSELWLETLRKEIDKANKMFSLSISVDWRVNPKTDIADGWTGTKEGVNNE